MLLSDLKRGDKFDFVILRKRPVPSQGEWVLLGPHVTDPGLRCVVTPEDYERLQANPDSTVNIYSVSAVLSVKKLYA